MTTGFPELDKMNQVFFYSGFNRKDQGTKKGFQNLHSETLFLSFKDVVIVLLNPFFLSPLQHLTKNNTLHADRTHIKSIVEKLKVICFLP